MIYTDTQLKQALAKMLPGKLSWNDYCQPKQCLVWLDETKPELLGKILDTELLHLCWLVEETIDFARYKSELIQAIINNDPVNTYTQHATWQQRTIALCKVKGIEIV